MNSPYKIKTKVLGAITLAIVGGLIAVVVLWTQRAPLVEWAICHAVVRIGLDPCAVEVKELTASHAQIEVRSTALGSIRRIDLRYSASDLLHGRVDQIRIDGANLRMTYREGRFTPQLTSAGSPSSSPVMLPARRIEFANSTLTIDRANDHVAIAFSGSITGNDPLRVDLALNVDAEPDRIVGHLTADLNPAGHVHRIAFKSAPFELEARAEGSADARYRTTIETRATGAFLELLAGGVGRATGALRANIHGVTPPMPSLVAARALTAHDWVTQGHADGEIDAALNDLTLPKLFGFKTAQGALAFNAENGRVTATAKHDIEIVGPTLDESTTIDSAQSLQIKRVNLAAKLNQPLLEIVEMSASPKFKIFGVLSVESSRGTVTADTQIRLTADPRLSGLDANEPLSLSFWVQSVVSTSPTTDLPLLAGDIACQGRVRLTSDATDVVADSAAITVHDLQWQFAPLLRRPLRIEIAPGASVRRERVGHKYKIDAALQPFNAALALPGSTGQRENVDVQKARLALSANELTRAVTLTDGQVQWSTRGLTIDGIAGTVADTASMQTAKLSLDEIRSSLDPAPFAPLHADMNATLNGARIDFAASLTNKTKQFDVKIKGTHRTDTGQGSAGLRLSTIDLGRLGNLKSVSPLLAARLSSATGTISGGGTTYWGANTPASTLTLTLSGVGLTTPSFAIEEVSAALQLSSLSPLESPAGQQAKGVLRVPAFAPIPFVIRFGLVPNRFIVEHASAMLFDGEVTTDGAVTDAASNSASIIVGLKEIDLEAALNILGLEGLKGTGRIGGALPVRVQDGLIAVSDGHLSATTPGTLRIGADAITEQLKQYGNNADLAFRALTNFHYHTLKIDADKPSTGTGTAHIRLEGSNPQVLDGHPFVFNINLQSDFDKLAKLMAQLSGAANSALGWGTRKLKSP